MDSSKFKSASFEQQKESIHKSLLELSTTGTKEFPYSLVDSNSIYYSQSDCAYQYEYLCGMSGEIPLSSYATSKGETNSNSAKSSNWTIPVVLIVAIVLMLPLIIKIHIQKIRGKF